MIAEELTLKTTRRTEMVDITRRVADVVAKSGVGGGMCYVYVPHTTAGVTINENADPSVRQDIATVLDRLVPWDANYTHAEGNSANHAT